MKRIYLAGGAAVCILLAGAAQPALAFVPPALNSTYEDSSGPTLDTTFLPIGDGNWISSLGNLSAHSGQQFFESDNGNLNSDFLGKRYVKQLGGSIQPTPYNVSFYIASNLLSADFKAVKFSDFTQLLIGGAGGAINWTSTPDPVPGGGWVEWRGVYSPSPADVGTPFRFGMTVNINSRHSLAIDGPMIAEAVPEPAPGALAAMAIGACALRRRRIRTTRPASSRHVDDR